MYTYFEKSARAEQFTSANQPVSTEQLDQFLHNAYASIGLYVNAEGLLKEADGWWIGVNDSEPDVYHWFIAFRTTPFGRKIIYMGSDGTRAAITEFKHVFIQLMNNQAQHYYCEASGAIERILERGGVPMVPAEKVEDITKKNVTLIDEYRYSRAIGGSPHEKVMFGYPKAARLKNALLHRD